MRLFEVSLAFELFKIFLFGLLELFFTLLLGSRVRPLILGIKFVPAFRLCLLSGWITHLDGIFDPGTARLLWPVIQNIVILITT